MKIDKEIQKKILLICREKYPYLGDVGKLRALFPDMAPLEQVAALEAHVKPLQEYGYLKGYCLTADGLREVGEDILYPDPYAVLRDALLEQAKTLRNLSPQDEKSLRSVLRSLSKTALDALVDTTMEALFSLVFPPTK